MNKFKLGDLVWLWQDGPRPAIVVKIAGIKHYVLWTAAPNVLYSEDNLSASKFEVTNRHFKDEILEKEKELKELKSDYIRWKKSQKGKKSPDFTELVPSFPPPPDVKQEKK